MKYFKLKFKSKTQMNLEVLFQLGSLLFVAAGPLVIILLASRNGSGL
jgi:hypothetical protein